MEIGDRKQQMEKLWCHGKAVEKLQKSCGKSGGKSCGNIATKWIGDRRYDWRLETRNGGRKNVYPRHNIVVFFLPL